MNYKKGMILILCILIAIALTLAIGKANLSFKFHQEVKQLFTQSSSNSSRTFSYQQLIGLPLPVQAYFKHVLKEGQPYIQCVRLMHDGQFKTGLEKEWVDIRGEQYFTIEKPGFVWKGNTTLFTARDMYIADAGRLVVSILSLIKVVDAKGEKYNQGELLRWLAESTWFPSNLLPSEKLHWTPIDDKRAKLTFHHNELQLNFLVTFNDFGEIIQLETKRYMDEKNIETWICKLSNYKELNGIFIPTTAEAIWRLKEVDYSYAKFNVQKIEYNQPQIF